MITKTLDAKNSEPPKREGLMATSKFTLKDPTGGQNGAWFVEFLLGNC
jgi:hypothetical protein